MLSCRTHTYSPPHAPRPQIPAPLSHHTCTPRVCQAGMMIFGTRPATTRVFTRRRKHPPPPHPSSPRIMLLTPLPQPLKVLAVKKSCFKLPARLSGQLRAAKKSIFALSIRWAPPCRRCVSATPGGLELASLDWGGRACHTRAHSHVRQMAHTHTHTHHYHGYLCPNTAHPFLLASFPLTRQTAALCSFFPLF